MGQQQDRLRALVARITTDYNFQCEAGPLVGCIEWRQLVVLLTEMSKQLTGVQQAIEGRYDLVNVKGIRAALTNEVQEPSTIHRGTLTTLAKQLRAMSTLAEAVDRLGEFIRPLLTASRVETAPRGTTQADTLKRLYCATGKHDYWYPQNEPPCCRWCGTVMSDVSPLPKEPQPHTRIYHHAVNGKSGCGAPLVRGNSMPELNHVTCSDCIQAWLTRPKEPR